MNFFILFTKADLFSLETYSQDFVVNVGKTGNGRARENSVSFSREADMPDLIMYQNTGGKN